MQDKIDFKVQKLGHYGIPSPLNLSRETNDYMANYVDDNEYIVYNINRREYTHSDQLTHEKLLECAGPREKMYFDPKQVNAGIVTCAVGCVPV